MNRIRGFYHDTELIKVITGIRRCGKSCLMQTVTEELKESGVQTENIIYIYLDKRGYKSIKTPEQLEDVDNLLNKAAAAVNRANSLSLMIVGGIILIVLSMVSILISVKIIENKEY